MAEDTHRPCRRRFQGMPATNKLIKSGHSYLLNCAINALFFELHIPDYQFCGPGTHLEKRLARGDQSVNPLDAEFREHDIAYSRNNEFHRETRG